MFRPWISSIQDRAAHKGADCQCGVTPSIPASAEEKQLNTQLGRGLPSDQISATRVGLDRYWVFILIPIPGTNISVSVLVLAYIG